LIQPGKKAGLFLGAILSCVAALPNQRVWDDEEILGTRLSPESVTSAFQLWREPYWNREPQDGFRPLGLTILNAERRVFGESMFGFHVVSLLLNGLVVLMLLHVLRQITDERVAWLAAVLFAIHPVHTETVTMAYGQLELLSALFALLTINEYLASKLSLTRLAAALIFAFLSICSKESGLMLPALLVLLRGVYLKPESPWTTRWLTWREGIFALPGVAYLLMRRAALGTWMAAPESAITYGYSTALHVKAVIVSLGSAIRLSIFPTRQTLYYGHLRDHLLNRPWPEAAWIGGGAVLFWILGKQIGWKITGFALGWFLVTLFPVLNIVPCGVLVAERNQYLPSAAFVFLAASLASRMRWGRVAYAVTAMFVAFCMIDSNLVARQWRDRETLWRTTVSSYPKSPMAHAGLGDALLEQSGREDEAEKCFERALELNPDVIGGKHGMGIIAMRRGDFTRALVWLEQAQESEPSSELSNEINECKLRIAGTR